MLRTRTKTGSNIESKFRQDPKQTLQIEHARVEVNGNGLPILLSAERHDNGGTGLRITEDMQWLRCASEVDNI